jgi:hypothetical protein
MDKFSLTLLTTNETVVFNEYSKYKSNPHHIVIFPEDKINELKEKLYIAIGIPPYKQHLFVVTQDNFAVPLYYNIIANGLVNVDIRELHTTKGSEDIDYNLIADSILGNDTAPPENKTETEKPETPKKAPKVPKAEKRAVTSKFPKISGVPIDTRLYEEGDGIVVEGKDVFMTVGKVVDMFPNCKFMCANIDDYITEDIVDADHMRLVYYGFVIKYFPMITFDAFNTYIKKPDQMSSSYPELSPKLSAISSRYELERVFLTEKYNAIKNGVNAKKFMINMENLSKMKPSDIKINVKDVTIVSSKLVATGKLNKWNYGNAFLNLEQLFKNFHTSENVPFLRVKYLYENRIISLSRIYEKKLNFSIFKNNLDDRLFNTALFVLRVEQTEKFVSLIVRDGGYYEVFINWSGYDNSDFNLINKSVVNTVNPFINNINAYGRKVFTSAGRLETLHLSHIMYKNINMSLTYNINSSGASFIKLESFIKSLQSSGIVKNVPEEMDFDHVKGNDFSFVLTKGMYEEDIYAINTKTSLANYYMFMSDSTIKTIWNSVFLGGRIVTFYHQTNSINVTVNGIQEGEFINFYNTVVAIFIKFAEFAKNTTSLKTNDSTNVNIISLLKSKDPELFAFAMKGKIKDYSRISQKINQPYPYTEEDYMSLPENIKEKATKFWNFTTSKPMYYVCPNKKYPYVNFIVGKHPKNYCLPSCKKTSPLSKSKVNSNKMNIYDCCVNNHIYEENVEVNDQNRYIINYGKEIDINRISALPESLDKWISYNAKDTDAESDESKDDVIEYVGEKYVVRKLWQITRNNIVRMIPISMFTEDLTNKNIPSPFKVGVYNSITDIVDKPRLNKVVYNQIVNSDITQPIIVITNKDKGLTIVEGTHRAARILQNAMISGEDELVPAKFITTKQIGKSRAPNATEQISSNIKKILKKTIHHPNYYLLGVSQDAGVINSVATCLTKNPNEMLLELANFIKKYKNPVSSEFANTEIAEMAISKTISNKLLFKLVYMFYKVNVLMIEEKLNKISIIFPYDINNITEIFPETETDYNYVIIFKKTNVDYITSEMLSSYYPMFVIVPQDFFKNYSIKTKVFSVSDEIITICKSACEDSVKYKSVESMTLTIYNLNKIFGGISTVFVNNSGYCYAGVATVDGQKLLVPIEYSYPENIEGIEYISGINDGKRVGKYNKNVKLVRKYLDLLKIYKDKKITDIYVKDENVMGFKIGRLIYEVIVNAREFVTSMEKYMDSESYIVPIAHAYHEIDEAIYNYGISEPDELKDVDTIIEKRNSYNAYIMDFMSKLDNEKNAQVRKKVTELLRGITAGNRADTISKLSELMDEADKAKIVSIMDDYYKRRLNKSDIIDIFNHTVYVFDRITVKKIYNAVENYKLLNGKEQKKARASIEGIVRGVIKTDSTNTKNIVDEILNPYRRWYILSTSYKIKMLTMQSFDKNEDENIYVYLN